MEQRKQIDRPISLTEAAHRVLVRAMTSRQPFAVFAIDGRLVISNLNTGRFNAMQRRALASFIATYGPGIKIADALEDLREFFTDERPAEHAA